MDIPHDSSAGAGQSRRVGRFVALQALVWLLVAPILAIAAARLAVWVQNFRAPLLIFPLLVGCGLGLLLWGLMRLGQVGHRATIWAGVVFAVGVTVGGQHYFSFLDYQAARLAERPQGLSPAELMVFQEMKPEASIGFGEFMRQQAAQGRPLNANYALRGAAAWASWATDGLLTLMAAWAIVYVACRAPYCSTCRSWYRTIRTGPLAADRARRMAEAASLPIGERQGEIMGPARYRLSHCVSGCGPSRLELAWRGPAGSKVLEGWLSAGQHEQVVRALHGE